MNYLIDTIVLSELFRRSPNNQVKIWMLSKKVINLSVITIEETYFGLNSVKANKHILWFDNFLASNSVNVIKINSNISKKCALMRSNFRKQGITRTQADMLIAASAIEHNLTLATRNIKDFEFCNLNVINPFE